MGQNGLINKIADLIPDDKNANKGTERGNAFIERSLREYGAGRSILIDKNGKIIAGNKTIENAGAVGLEDLVVVQTDGTQIVAVQRIDLDMDSDPRARELALADNRAGDLNLAWDGPVLAELGKEIDLQPFFSTDELAELVGGGGAGGDQSDAPKAQVDRAEELREKWQTAKGQIWEATSPNSDKICHRLMCADSTDELSVSALCRGVTPSVVWSDPPYGLGGYAGRSGALSAVKGDDADRDTLLSFYRCGDAPETYVCCEFKTYPILVEARGIPRSLIVWVKNVFGMGNGYRRQYEFIAYWGSFKSTTESDVWQQKKDNNYIHPTQKPWELAARAIENSSPISGVVYCPFGGSGDAFVASEKKRRSCFGMELEPKYVAVILERLSEMGLAPKLVSEYGGSQA